MNLVEVRAVKNHHLFVRYEDGSSGEVDLSGFVGKGVFTAWERPGVFEKVTLADAGHPEWPGGLDLCPDFLYMQLTGKRLPWRPPPRLLPWIEPISGSFAPTPVLFAPLRGRRHP